MFDDDFTTALATAEDAVIAAAEAGVTDFNVAVLTVDDESLLILGGRVDEILLPVFARAAADVAVDRAAGLR